MENNVSGTKNFMDPLCISFIKDTSPSPMGPVFLTLVTLGTDPQDG